MNFREKISREFPFLEQRMSSRFLGCPNVPVKRVFVRKVDDSLLRIVPLREEKSSARGSTGKFQQVDIILKNDRIISDSVMPSYIYENYAGCEIHSGETIHQAIWRLEKIGELYPENVRYVVVYAWEQSHLDGVAFVKEAEATIYKVKNFDLRRPLQDIAEEALGLGARFYDTTTDARYSVDGEPSAADRTHWYVSADNKKYVGIYAYYSGGYAVGQVYDR